jgi:hypothetical protein
VEEMARACEFVRRRSPVTGMRFLLTFTTGLLNTPDGTLAQLAAFLGGTCGAEVSAQAVDQRISALAQDFLGRCLSAALRISAATQWGADDVLGWFDHLYVIDSTNFSLDPALADTFKGSGGGASKAAMRIQFLFDYRTGTMHIQLGDVTLSDTAALADLVRRHSLPQDGVCLFLSDLGYFKMATFTAIHENPDHHFLSKLQFGVKPIAPDGTVLDLKRLLKKKPRQLEAPVKVGSKTCRLVATRLPDEAVAIRIRRANQDSRSKKRQITDEYRLFLHYAIFITSLPPIYAMEQLFALYRIRWQIELTFKIWKSILAIHRIRSAREDRVRCEVQGKLIVAVLVSILATNVKSFLDGLAISTHKVARQVRALATNWAQAIQMGTAKHRKFLQKLTRIMARSCRKSSRKKKPSLEERLAQALGNTAPPPGREAEEVLA